jgi:hypothetical protein
VDTPFSHYRDGGRTLLGPARGGESSRHGYGLPVLEQCGHDCAYCGRPLGEPYENWLDFSIDHVVPSNTLNLRYPKEWVNDLINLVTSCRACNEFLNQYKVTDPPPANLEEFCAIRDRHFQEKRARALARHAHERMLYERWRAGSGGRGSGPTVVLGGVSLSRDDVVRAIATFDREFPGTGSYDDWLAKESYKYALHHGGKVYPPKRILSLASGVRVQRFNGGSQTNHLLRSLGFKVTDKSAR